MFQIVDEKNSSLHVFEAIVMHLEHNLNVEMYFMLLELRTFQTVSVKTLKLGRSE